MDGTKTAVRFRDGRIIAPIAFSGNYNPPLVGCVDFSGVAETNIELEFDAQKQILIGRARVINVNLSGTGGIGGGLIAKMVQSSIDKEINPIQILEINKLSFDCPDSERRKFENERDWNKTRHRQRRPERPNLIRICQSVIKIIRLKTDDF